MTFSNVEAKAPVTRQTASRATLGTQECAYCSSSGMSAPTNRRPFLSICVNGRSCVQATAIAPMRVLVHPVFHIRATSNSTEGTSVHTSRTAEVSAHVAVQKWRPGLIWRGTGGVWLPHQCFSFPGKHWEVASLHHITERHGA